MALTISIILCLDNKKRGKAFETSYLMAKVNTQFILTCLLKKVSEARAGEWMGVVQQRLSLVEFIQ